MSLQQQQQYLSFQKASQHRQVLYCEQDCSDELLHCQTTQLIPILEQFLMEHPQWQQRLSIAHITPLTTTTVNKQQSSFSDGSFEKTVPFYHDNHTDPALVARADICVLLMNSDKQQKWLKEAHKICENDNNHNGSAGNSPIPKHVILVDPSKPLLPPSPPLLPVDEYKIITIQHADQITSTLHSILSSIHDSAGDKQAAAEPSHPQPLIVNQVIQEYQGAKKQRLFLFDYDGTLTPIVSRPEMALPTRSLLDYLSTLCRDPLNTVWIVSGRDQKFLHDCFGHMHGLGLSAEHGSFMKMPGESNWIDMLKDAVLPWKPEALAIFTSFTDGLPGTEIEQKKSSITWHYRNAHDLDAAVRKSHECHQALIGLPGVDILVGKMNLEVRSVLVNKGNVVKRIRQQLGGDNAADFVICAGDDQTDEDMFRALFHDNAAHTILVGPPTKLTLARFCVDTSQQVVDLLGQLASHQQQSSSL